MLDCLICRSEYNYTENLPKVLPDCGHTVCSACLAKILQTGKCPECRQTFTTNTPRDAKQFQTNIALQRIIETMTDFCKEHQSPLTQVCLTEKVKVCINCVKDGSHKDHVIEPLEKTRAKASKKIQDYKKTETDIDNIAKQNHEFLMKFQNEMLKAIEDAGSFQEYLEMAKRQYLWDLEFLLLKKASLDQSKMAEVIAYDEKILNFKKILEEEQINKELFEALEENIEFPVVDENQKSELQAFAQQLEHNFLSVVCKLENYGGSVIQKSFGEIETEFTNFLPVESKAVELTARLEVLSQKCFDYYTEDKTTLVIYPKTSNAQSTVVKESLEGLQTLVIHHAQTKFTDEMFDGLSSLWKSFASAISIRLDFNPHTFTTKDLFYCLDYPFWRKGSVANLSINLMGCKLDSEARLLEFLESVIRQASDLTGLSLKLDATNLTDLFFEPFIQNVVPLAENLQELGLSLSETKITKDGIKDLFTWNAQCPDKMLKLKGISLNIAKTSICVLGVNAIFQGMKEIDKCKKLSMDLSNLSLGFGGPGFAVDKFLKSARKLEVLSFNFSKVNLSPTSFNQICASFPPNLSELKVIFTETAVTDENVKKLTSTSLASMSCLENLELNFRDTGIGDNSLLALSEIFLKSKTIKGLVLNFYNTEISEELLNYLVTGVIPQMTCLSKLNIIVDQNDLGSETIHLIDQINQKYE